MPDGSLQTYWSHESTWGQCLGAGALQIPASVLAVTMGETQSVTAVNLIVQWSNDRENWVDSATSITGFDLSQAVSVNATEPDRPFMYAGMPYEMAQYVRFGIQIKWVGSSPDTQKLVRARLSVTVNILPGPSQAPRGPTRDDARSASLPPNASRT